MKYLETVDDLLFISRPQCTWVVLKSGCGGVHFTIKYMFLKGGEKKGGWFMIALYLVI